MGNEYRPRVAVVGAGVNGVGTALAILQSYPHVRLTVYSKHSTPHTTGDGSAGFWSPYIATGTPIENVIKWSKTTWNLFDSWRLEGKYGIFLTPVTKVSREEFPVPEWKDLTINFRELTQDDLKAFGPEFISGQAYTSIVAEPSLFLPNLMQTVKVLGGTFQRRNLRRLEDLGDTADIIVNCSGIGSYDLIPDPKVYPVRGQLLRASAPWFNKTVMDCSEEVNAYVIQNSTTIVLGGTAQVNDWNTTVDANDSRTIWQNCTTLEPSLKNAEIVSEWAGLRPLREGGIRIEENEISKYQKKIPVVHNYGHGGSGVTTFWGCALEAKDLVGNILNRYYAPTSSKL